MGYYTRYTLDWDNNALIADLNNSIADLTDSILNRELSGALKTAAVNELSRLESLAQGPDLPSSLQEITGYSVFDGPTKWYSWKSDMETFSTRYPSTLLTLTGHGEGSGDIWRAYFKNGSGYRVEGRIVFDSFDEGKLTEGNQ